MCWLCCFLLEKAMKDFHADNTRVTDVLRVPVVQKLGRAIHGGKLLSGRYTGDKIY